MKLILYADSFIIVNFILDYLCLYLSGYLLGLKQKITRFLAASFFGAAYSFFVLYWDAEPLLLTAVHILVSFLLCRIAYPVRGAVALVKLVVLFYLSCVLLGGAVNALYHLSGALDNSQKMDITLVIAAMILIYLIWNLFGRHLSKRLNNKAMQYEMEMLGEKIYLEGFVDSGNRLCDPITSSKVIVIKSYSLKRYLPYGFLEMLRGGTAENPDFVKRLKIIPYQGAGFSGILYGFRPEKITFSRNPAYNKCDFIVAVDFEEGNFAGYSSLIPLI